MPPPVFGTKQDRPKLGPPWDAPTFDIHAENNQGVTSFGQIVEHLNPNLNPALSDDNELDLFSYNRYDRDPVRKGSEY